MHICTRVYIHPPLDGAPVELTVLRDLFAHCRYRGKYSGVFLLSIPASTRFRSSLGRMCTIKVFPGRECIGMRTDMLRGDMVVQENVNRMDGGGHVTCIEAVLERIGFIFDIRVTRQTSRESEI